MSQRRRFLVAFLLVALLVAGVASVFASSLPDGLESVAERTGFSGTAEDSPATASPLADYETPGVADDRVSGALAGVLGALLVLVLGGALFHVLRRRSAEDAEAGDSVDETPGARASAADRDEV